MYSMTNNRENLVKFSHKYVHAVFRKIILVTRYKNEHFIDTETGFKHYENDPFY